MLLAELAVLHGLGCQAMGYIEPWLCTCFCCALLCGFYVLQIYVVVASLISPWLLWWPPAESHYNIYDHSAVGYVSHAHCNILLCSVGNKITTVETLYSTIYYSKYFIELNFDKSTQYVAFWTHKRHPIPRLSGELWSVFYEYFNRNWPCYKGFLLYYYYVMLQCGVGVWVWVGGWGWGCVTGLDPVTQQSGGNINHHMMSWLYWYETSHL